MFCSVVQLCLCKVTWRALVLLEQNKISAECAWSCRPLASVVGIHFIDPTSDERGEGNGRRAESGERQYVIHPSPLPHVSPSILIQTHPYIRHSVNLSIHPPPSIRPSIHSCVIQFSNPYIHSPAHQFIYSRPSTHQEIHQSIHSFTYSTSNYPSLILPNSNHPFFCLTSNFL
jgi:hypothetical protein